MEILSELKTKVPDNRSVWRGIVGVLWAISRLWIFTLSKSRNLNLEKIQGTTLNESSVFKLLNGKIMGEKRVVPGPLKKLLSIDATITSAFCHIFEQYLSPVKYRTHFKALEISCHGVPWLVVWIALFWILWMPELFEMQVNFLVGLLCDMLFVSIMKALVRRRRPVGNKPDMFMTVGADVYSFPSGHVSRAVFISLFFSQIYPIAGIFSLLLYIWALLVAVSRVLLKRHYLLDVAGGAVLGFIELGFIWMIWLSKKTSTSLITWLSEDYVDLEGLQDADID